MCRQDEKERTTASIYEKDWEIKNNAKIYPRQKGKEKKKRKTGRKRKVIPITQKKYITPKKEKSRKSPLHFNIKMK